MIQEPQPYDPDDPTDSDVNDLSYLLPDRGYRNTVIDPLDPIEY